MKGNMISGKTILIIVDSCYPNLSMNGVIAKNIADVLAKENRILTISLRRGDDDIEESFGEKVAYIKGFHYYEGMLSNKINRASNILKKKFFSVINYLVRIVSISFRIVSKNGVNNCLVNAFKKKANTMLRKDNIDYVICFSIPFESAIAMTDLAKDNKNVKFMLYQADNFVTGLDANYPKFLLKRRDTARISMVREFEKKLYKYRILVSAYENEKKYVDQSVVKPIGFPLVKENRQKNLDRSFDTIILTYTGSLVKGVRPPTETLELLEEVNKEIKITIDIYHRGNCNSLIEQHVKNNSFIVNHGAVGIDQSYEVIKNSDVLFCISTKAGDQISGKTFDYISTGKPIIFFYYKSEDMNLKIYEQYGLFLGIKLDRKLKQENVKRVADFIKKNGRKSIPFSEIISKYGDFTPEVVSEDLFST